MFLAHFTVHVCLDIHQIIVLALVVDAHIALISISKVTAFHRIFVIHLLLEIFQLCVAWTFSFLTLFLLVRLVNLRRELHQFVTVLLTLICEADLMMMV